MSKLGGAPDTSLACPGFASHRVQKQASGSEFLVGWPFAGQRITLRLDGKVLQVLIEQRVRPASHHAKPPAALGLRTPARYSSGRPVTAGAPAAPDGPPGRHSVRSTAGYPRGGQTVRW
ncbi:hypothetical protein GCM10010104_08200 [Streptomyces indiaensis]|uniref:Transposase n=1 Tax=Streptomyces indiaensis TaxID=284033 RepID=A0ABN3D5M9_9ACTN